MNQSELKRTVAIAIELEKKVRGVVANLAKLCAEHDPDNLQSFMNILCFELLSEAGRIFHLLDMPHREKERNTQMGLFAGEQRCLLSNGTITIEESVELLKTFATQLADDLDRKYGKEPTN